ncbi:hypothetical protein H0H92_012829, partial [Tricholoma furcatifolium]
MAAAFDVEKFVAPPEGIPKDGELSVNEVFWRQHYQVFKNHGYTLRPRYRPDWIPSWWNNTKYWMDCEDGMACFGTILDATRGNGSIVMIKAVEPHKVDAEIPIGKLLSSERLASPRNRCVPYIEVIESPVESGWAFIVMPYLMDTEEVPFETIGEAVEFLRQIFE